MHASTSKFHACLCISTHGIAEVADDGSVEEMSQAKAISLRFGIMAVVALVAALSFEFLGNVESVVGAVCSMSSSMLLPAFFFLRYNVMANLICPVNMLSLAQHVMQGAVYVQGSKKGPGKLFSSRRHDTDQQTPLSRQ